MLSVDEALEHVLRRAQPLAAECVPLADALGRMLAQDVISDVDSPPHDKSTVDGYAIQSCDLVDGSAELIVIESVMAGAMPSCTLASGQATAVMTGAPLPAGADAVVMVERTEMLADADTPRVRVCDPRSQAGQNILRQGASLRRGDVVLARGQLLRPIEIGLLAEVGCAAVNLVRRPRVAVLSTGNELVPVGQIPGAAQIRNSNEPMLMACVTHAGGLPIGLGIAGDNLDSLRKRITAGLETDVLILSGGVSAGVLDLVPGVLAELGVEQVFHKVQIKPGMPLWFGVKAAEPSGTMVFGLPGNPVSSYVCCELFVRPALARLAGHEGAGLPRVTARLAAAHRHPGGRPTYFPAVLRHAGDGPTVEPVRYQGSADLRGLATANALVYFPAEARTFEAGECVDVYLLDG